jgi:hypothetical protein
MTRHFILAASFGLILAILSVAQAADAPAKGTKAEKNAKPAKPAIEVISVTIHPAAEPKPALKYHLLPTLLESTPGDAVPLYAKALMEYVRLWTQIGNNPAASKEYGIDHLNEWLEMPPDKLPRERVRKLVDAFGGSIKSQLELAVRREHCNWDMPLREGHVFEIPLPETDEFRHLAHWIVALRARLQIAEGKYDEAITSLKTGYGMARHVAKQPFLVSGLTGLGIANSMNEQLLTLCQQSGAPDLYWSLAELPTPLIDPQMSIQAEYDGLYLQWPELQTLRHAQYVPEQWNRVLRKVVSELVVYENEFSRYRWSDKQRAEKIAQIIAHAVDNVPKAKAAMLAAGYAQKELDAMAPAQVVLLYSLDTYDAIRDELFKWWHLPYPQAADAILRIDRNISSVEWWHLPSPLAGDGTVRDDRDLASVRRQEIIPFASTLLPSVSVAKFAFPRTERQLAAIRCIEALRLYAGTHNGELPARLDDITEVPIPLNPVTGKPFGYHLEGKTAVLDADGGLTNSPRPQYRIVVAK